jgi:uncharacterized coiled-coil DUF342 family protein
MKDNIGKKRQAKIYREEINQLREKYNSLLATLPKKSMEEFRVIMSEANAVLGKMNTLKKKADNLDNNLPEHGYSDWHDGYRIVE